MAPAQTRTTRAVVPAAPIRGPLLASLLACAVTAALLGLGAWLGWWFLPFAAGIVAGAGPWRTLPALGLVVLAVVVGWGAALWWPALSGAPAGATARVIAALAGLPRTPPSAWPPPCSSASSRPSSPSGSPAPSPTACGAPPPAEYSAGVASPGSVNPVSNAVPASQVSAILLDAGGVLVFPEPDRLLPPLRAAGVDPDLATLERAHYRAMAIQDAEALPPVRESWWRNYLLGYVAACGVGPKTGPNCSRPRWPSGSGDTPGPTSASGPWTACGRWPPSACRWAWSPTRTAAWRATCAAWASATSRPPPTGQDPSAGVAMGVILDSAVVGVAKPDPAIFRIALDALGVPADRSVLHVGDSLRYDVAGALAAGLQPVHMDPYGFCPAPDGHPHVRSLAELAGPSISNQR